MSVIIVVAGCSASGKTTFCNMLQQELKNINVSSTVISADSFYHGAEDGEDASKRNYDHPKAFDEDLMEATIVCLKAGVETHIPIYDYTTHSRVTGSCDVVYPKQVIILEGILTMHSKRIRDLADRTVYIHTPLDICFIRRLQRDIRERGRDIQSIIDQYELHVRPSYITYIEPSGDYADFTVNNVTKYAHDMFSTGECRGLIAYVAKHFQQ